MSQISIDLSTLQPDQIWNLVVNDKLKWLQHFYQKNGVSKDVSKQILPLFNQLKDKIKNSQFDQREKYFAKFKQIQSQKLHPRLIQLDKIQPSFEKKEHGQKQMQKKQNNEKNSWLPEHYIQCQQDYKKLLLNNHKQIIKFLTRQRYSFSYLAQHIYQESMEKGESFFFFVEKGHPIDRIDKTQELSIGLLYVLVRDLTKGIKQLRQHGIIHLDLDLQNILLFCCYNIQGLKELKKLNLNNPKQLATIIDKIRFKFIDFGNAFANNEQLKQNNQKLMKKRAQISKYFTITDMFTSKFQNDYKILMQLIQLIQQKQSHKVQEKARSIYQNGFARIIQKMIKQIKSFDSTLLNQFKDKYAEMFKQGKYQQIIKEMNQKIKQFKEQPSS